MVCGLWFVVCGLGFRVWGSRPNLQPCIYTVDRAVEVGVTRVADEGALQVADGFETHAAAGGAVPGCGSGFDGDRGGRGC